MSKVHMVFGAQGAGKTTYSKQLSEEVNGVHLSIDEWMWKLYGQDLPKSMNLKWLMERVERCEDQIWNISKGILNCDSPVILDLGFTKVAKRKKFMKLAEEHSVEVQLYYLKAPHTIRRKRVLDRNKQKGETFSFEVTPGMFDFMEGEFHRPTEEELAKAMVIDTHMN